MKYSTDLQNKLSNLEKEYLEEEIENSNDVLQILEFEIDYLERLLEKQKNHLREEIPSLLEEGFDEYDYEKYSEDLIEAVMSMKALEDIHCQMLVEESQTSIDEPEIESEPLIDSEDLDSEIIDPEIQ